MKEKTFFKQSVAVIIICNLILGQTIPVFAESGVTDEAIVQSEDEVESNTEEVEVIRSESETESNIGEDILIQSEEGENSEDEETVDVNLLENSTSEEVAEEDFSDSESTECLEEEFDDGEERLLSEENSEEITLYALNPNVTAISIPTEMPTSYLLPQEDGAEYKLISGEGVKVESNGRVVPITQKRYVYVITGGSGMKEEYSFGENIVSMTVGNHTQIYKVNVVDYAQYYAEQKMNAFLEENITSSMTEYEKVEKICKWLTSEFDYNANYSSDVAIMIYGGADCWGYSNAVNYLCKKCGMQAYLRYAAHDLGREMDIRIL